MLILVGSGCFGVVIGWIVYRTMRRSSENVKLGDISTVIAAVGGAAIPAILNNAESFAAYSIGLALGFVLYFLVALVFGGTAEASRWMGD